MISARTVLLLVGLNMLWSPVNFMIKAAGQSFSPSAIGVFRWSLFGAFLLAALAFPKFRRATGAVRLDPADALRAAALGALFVAPAHVLYYLSMGMTSSIEGSVLVTTSPVWTALFAWLILRESVSAVRWAAVALGCFGAYVVVAGFGLPNMQGSHTLGNALFLSGIVLESMAFVLAAKVVRRSSGITVLASQVIGMIAAMAFLPLLMPATFPFWVGPITTGGLLGLGYLVCVASMICFSLWFMSAERAPLSLMAITIMVQPPVAAILGWLFLREQISADLLIGTVLIGAALGVASWEASRRPIAHKVADNQADEHDYAQPDQPVVAGMGSLN